MPPPVAAVTRMRVPRPDTSATVDAPPTNMGDMYARYGEAISRFCARRLPDPTTVEDACHETILRAHASLPSFEPGARVWPWLATIAAHVCADMHRANGPVSFVADPPTMAESTTPHDEAVQHQQEEMVSEAIGLLPERDRTLLYLRDVEGWSWEELAALEDRTVPGVRSALWRAHTALRRAVALVARERHWPLPVVLGVFWSRLRSRAIRARVSLDSAAVRASRWEAAASQIVREGTVRVAVGGAAALSIVLPMAAEPSAPDAVDEALTLTEETASGGPGTTATPTVLDRDPGTAGALGATDPGTSDRPAGEPTTPDGAAASGDEPEGDDDVGSIGLDEPTVSEPPEPSAPVTSTSSTGEVQSDDDEHSIEGPSAGVEPDDDVPEPVHGVDTKTVNVYCPPEDERSDAMSAACTPLDTAESGSIETDDEAVPEPESESESTTTDVDETDDQGLTQT